MKIICAFFLALFALGQLAKADTILIYQGSQSADNNSLYKYMGRMSCYLLFDVTTLQSVSIEYGGTTPAEYYYSVGQSAAFVYAPITTGASTSQTYFASGSTNAGPAFSLDYTYYVGDNLPQELGGTLTGQFPTILTYSDSNRSGNSSTGSDVAGQKEGVYLLNLELTRESNASNDDLATATGVVTAALTKVGFVSN